MNACCSALWAPPRTQGEARLISVETFGWTSLPLPEVRDCGSCSLRLGTNSSLVDLGPRSPISLWLGPLCPRVTSRALPLTGSSQPLPLVIFIPDMSQWIPERDSVGFSLRLRSGLGLAALSSVGWTGDDDGCGLPVVFVL